VVSAKASCIGLGVKVHRDLQESYSMFTCLSSVAFAQPWIPDELMHSCS
jgi:hypothetical protein